MPSAWVTTRITAEGQKRYRVKFRLRGGESTSRYAGSLPTNRWVKEAKRRSYIKRNGGGDA